MTEFVEKAKNKTTKEGANPVSQWFISGGGNRQIPLFLSFITFCCYFSIVLTE
jgi:hypothetical protein